MEMKEHLYEVSLRHVKTGERITLQVWAENTDAATDGLVDVLIGYRCEYEWRGTGPVYKDNKLVSRTV